MRISVSAARNQGTKVRNIFDQPIVHSDVRPNLDGGVQITIIAASIYENERSPSRFRYVVDLSPDDLRTIRDQLDEIAGHQPEWVR